MACDFREVVHEAWPAQESVLARYDELCVRQSDPGGTGIECMMCAGARQRIGVAGSEPANQGLGLLALVLEARTGWQGADGHDSSFRSGPVRMVGPKRGCGVEAMPLLLTDGNIPSRGPGALRRR